MKRIDWILVAYMSIPTLAMVSFIVAICVFFGGCSYDSGDTEDEKAQHQINRDDDCKRTVQLSSDAVWCGGVRTGIANMGDAGAKD